MAHQADFLRISSFFAHPMMANLHFFVFCAPQRHTRRRVHLFDTESEDATDTANAVFAPVAPVAENILPPNSLHGMMATGRTDRII